MSDPATISPVVRGWRSGSFRLEALAQYTVEFEADEFEAFLRGDPVPPPNPPEFDAWSAQLRQERAEGRIRSRVHAIAGPLTPYLRYEIEWGYTSNAAAGEDIRILHVPRWSDSPFGEQPPDFYLLDDERVVLMAYDGTGHWLGGEEITASDEVARYRRLRDMAVGAAVPLADYLAALRRLPITSAGLAPWATRRSPGAAPR
ncbi:MAG TPA: hypothetical protein VGP96_12350 [Candidatus Dormibacteraeota bacterium]|nr:hypothetical protein [Candidatus Dormibacteraeota bacterium]